jgi:hypothetical protein
MLGFFPPANAGLDANERPKRRINTRIVFT